MPLSLGPKLREGGVATTLDAGHRMNVRRSHFNAHDVASLLELVQASGG